MTPEDLELFLAQVRHRKNMRLASDVSNELSFLIALEAIVIDASREIEDLNFQVEDLLAILDERDKLIKALTKALEPHETRRDSPTH